MDALERNPHYETAEKVLTELACFYANPSQYRTLKVFDRQSGNFLLLSEGWQGYHRIHNLWAHVEYRDGKFWIHEDGTEKGIANLLVEQGVSKFRIVLALDEPALRDATEFAVA